MHLIFQISRNQTRFISIFGRNYDSDSIFGKVSNLSCAINVNGFVRELHV